MRTRLLVVLCLLCAVLVPARVQAQADAFSTLPLRVNLGDTLVVVDDRGVQVRGRLVQITPADLVLETRHVRRLVLPSSRVREVSKHVSDPVDNGALIGFGVGAGLGLGAGFAVRDRTGGSPSAYAILSSGVFAGLGALVDAAVRHDVVVYRAPAVGVSPVIPVPAAPIAAAAQGPGTFGELPLRLDLGDRVTVVDKDGARLEGRIINLTPGEIVLQGDVASVTIAGDRVRHIGRCCDSIRNGALIGGLALGTLGFLGGVRFADRVEVGDGLFLAAISGAIGAGVGAGVDALVAREVIIYRARPRSVQVRTDVRRRAVLVTVTF